MRKVIGELPFSAPPELDEVTRHMDEMLREKTEIGGGLARRLLTLGDPDDPYIGGSSPTALALCKRRNADEIRRALDADDDPFTDDGSDNDLYDTSRSKRGPRGRQVPGWYQLQPIVMHNQLLPLSFDLEVS